MCIYIYIYIYPYTLSKRISFTSDGSVVRHRASLGARQPAGWLARLIYIYICMIYAYIYIYICTYAYTHM